MLFIETNTTNDYLQLINNISNYVKGEKEDINLYIMTISQNIDSNRFEKLDLRLYNFT
jgi:hypothetical protein